jgi:hypothetical protein
LSHPNPTSGSPCLLSCSSKPAPRSSVTLSGLTCGHLWRTQGVLVCPYHRRLPVGQGPLSLHPLPTHFLETQLTASSCAFLYYLRWPRSPGSQDRCHRRGTLKLGFSFPGGPDTLWLSWSCSNPAGRQDATHPQKPDTLLPVLMSTPFL